ncbi:hypothetical protein ACIOBL_20845 [Paenibacillus taichungensis]|uniref:hypothetical protein n=1 Tax=Paenibacillus TaxID=44249 RepID=UPI0022A92545|nr:hypothetical protein [Paenibacillus tundrae]MCZ1263191.1 hypothetical protein [Paenibacillus tundrae]
MTRNRKRGAYVLFIIVLVGFLLLIRSCKTEEFAPLLTRNNIQPEQVMVVAPVDSRTHLVLYQDTQTEGIASALIQDRKWSSEVAKSGSVLDDNKDGPISYRLTGYQYSNDNTCYIVYGYIHNPDITRLLIRHEPNSSVEEVEAGILDPSDQGRLWFAVIQQPITEMQMDIRGLDNAGNMIYSSLDNED